MMRKILTIIVLAAAIALPSQAQVNFGLKGGLNLTEMSLDNSSVESMVSNKSGFFIGPTIKFTLPVVGLGIDAAALYDQREAEIKGSDEKLKQQTVQVPINVRYAFGLGDLASIFVFAGPQFGFNVGDKATDIIKSSGEWSLKSSNLSANVGIGAFLANHLQASVNYNIALGKTGEVSVLENGALKSSEVKNNAWQIALAYFF